MPECTPSTQYTVYPCDIDSSDQLPLTVDNKTPVRGEVVNRHRDALIAIEAELGIQPSGTFTTVRARLDALEALLANELGSLQLGLSEVLDEGVTIRNNVTSINFTGDVTVTSAVTSGRVNVAIAGGGEVNTASNIGSGANIFSSKVSTDLQFRGVEGTNGLTDTVNGSNVEIGISEIESALTAETNTSLVLKPDGVGGVNWASGGGAGGGESLSQTLNIGNTTDGYDIIVSDGDSVVFANLVSITGDGGSQPIINTDADGYINIGDVGGTDVVEITNTSVNISLDTTIDGKLTVTGLIDPTGLVLDVQASVPGGTPDAGKATLWIRSSDGYVIRTDESGEDLVLSGGGGTGGGESLSQTLNIGNTTGGFDIDVTSGDVIDFQGEADIQRQGTSIVTTNISGTATNVLGSSTVNIFTGGGTRGIFSSAGFKIVNLGLTFDELSSITNPPANDRRLWARNDGYLVATNSSGDDVLLGRDIRPNGGITKFIGGDESIELSLDEIANAFTAETDTALVLKPDGVGGVAWGADAGGAGGGESLSQTLNIGNTTDGYDIDVTSGDVIDFQDEIDIQRQGSSVLTTGDVGVVFTTLEAADLIQLSTSSAARLVITDDGPAVVNRGLTFDGIASVTNPGSGDYRLWVNSSGQLVLTDETGADTIFGTGSGGSETLSETLDFGNTTDGYDIIISDGDILSFAGVGEISQVDDATADATADNFTFHAQDVTGSGTTITAGTLTIRAGNANAGTATTRNGGDLTLSSGRGHNNSTAGVVQINAGSLEAFNSIGSITYIRSVAGTSLNIGTTSILTVTTASVTENAPTHQFAQAVVSPTINQQSSTSSDDTGDSLTINAQDVTGSGTEIIGGDLVLRAGNTSGGSASAGQGGDVYITTGDALGTGDAGNFFLETGDGYNVLSTTDDGYVDIGDLTNGSILELTDEIVDVFVSLQVRGGDIKFIDSLSAATISQALDDDADATGNVLTIHSQDVTGSGTTIIGGNLTVRAGNTSSGTATDGYGGDLYLSGGDGLGGGFAGNVAFGSLPEDVIDFRNMHRGLFLATAEAIPTGPPVGGWFVYDNGGDLTFHGPDDNEFILSGSDISVTGDVSGNTGTFATVNSGTMIDATAGTIINTSSSDVIFGGASVNDVTLDAGGSIFFFSGSGNAEMSIEDGEIVPRTDIVFSSVETTPAITVETVGDASVGILTIRGGSNNSATLQAGSVEIRPGLNGGAGADGVVVLNNNTGNIVEITTADELGFFGVTPVTRPDVTGSAGGNAALQSLLTALENLGLITDSST